MRIGAALAVLVLLVAGFRYVRHWGSGKMSAEKLEYFIQNGTVSEPLPDPENVTCRADPQNTWDYICTDPPDSQVWGFNVDRSSVTRVSLLKGTYPPW